MKPVSPAKPAENIEEDAPANAFLITLADIANGALTAEGSAALKEIHDRLETVAGKAILTCKLAFRSDGNGQVQIAYEITTKTPKMCSPISLAYLSGDGRFLRRDPKQRELPFVHGAAEEERPRIHKAS